MGQVLTLADLTPAGSEPNLLSKGRRGTPLITNSQPLRSSYTDLRNVSTHLSPRDQEVYQVWVFLTLSLKGETFKEHFCNIDTFSTRKVIRMKET